jgi:hypothetical protein
VFVTEERIAEPHDVIWQVALMQQEFRMQRLHICVTGAGARELFTQVIPKILPYLTIHYSPNNKYLKFKQENLINFNFC